MASTDSAQVAAGWPAAAREHEACPPPLVVGAPSHDADAQPEEEIPYSVSFSVPASPSGMHLGASVVRVHAAPPSVGEARIDMIHPAEPPPQMLWQQARFHSQPTLTVINGEAAAPVPRSDSTRDRRFDQFKTFSGRLERQFSSLRGMLPQEPAADIETADSKISEEEADGGEVPTADRYFAALEGPELDTLRVRHFETLASSKFLAIVTTRLMRMSACRRRRCRCCPRTRGGRSCCGFRSARSGCAWA
ncbi:Os05g0584900 [Oryza sativa Japonica Group]|jgi:hypothetical protein|uniref:Os05g0584900 protein n=1 Tax=Oryza sativa subsp. japonica TaxID=39947 RepID=A0A0N7KLB6_ORYSJ|nr:hypothetical protein EE612_031401 [Oryza sativa]BAS95561.1 Os05g0584900 [Oryza sativa Japonica Group]